MIKRRIPKSSGLYVKVEVDGSIENGKRKKFTSEDTLWLDVLCRSAVYKTMPAIDVKSQLIEAGFPEYLIDAFLASRSNMTFGAGADTGTGP